MISFTTVIQQFAEQGEKTGWTYIEIPADVAEQLKPGSRKGFRVKGNLDHHIFSSTALLPMGEGQFIMALNAAIRKKIGKRKGATLQVRLEEDTQPFAIPAWIQDCLRDEPAAESFFTGLPQGHQRYFITWIESAKTDATRTKRLGMAVNALSRKLGYPEMIRLNKIDN